MRCRVTGTKVNQKNRYDSHECEESGLTDESQDHVLNCKGIIDMHGEIEISEIPPYENIMEGNVNEQAKMKLSSPAGTKRPSIFILCLQYCFVELEI